MKEKLYLQIPEPCHENWETMNDTEKGRFCLSCQKEVVDFSNMTDKQVLEHISKTSSGICGRLCNDQLNRELVMPREPNKIGWRYWMSVAASLLMIASKSDAQARKPKNDIVCAPASIDTNEIVIGKMADGISPGYDRKSVVSGIVKDESDHILPGATITIKNSTVMVSADENGEFVIQSNKLNNATLIVSYIGYQSQEVVLGHVSKGNTFERVVVHIPALKAQMLGEVVVKASSLSGKMGGLSMGVLVYRYNAIEKFKNLISKKEIRIFPNPISRNSMFNMAFDVRSQGTYSLQVLDQSGKAIAQKDLNIVMSNQLEKFNANIFPVAGVYFARIISKQGVSYTAKMIVQ